MAGRILNQFQSYLKTHDIWLILSVVLSPMLGNMMSAMFWFVTYHFTIMPVILIIPVFLLLGWLIPAVLYHAGKRQSIVENLREL